MKKMKKVIFYISLIVFTIGSCKKVDLEEVPSGDPVFSVDAKLDGVDLNLVAGDDDFYMFSEFSKDNFDVYTMTGRFAKDSNCNVECEESLSFSIRSSYVDSLPNAPFEINSALTEGTNLNYFSNMNSTSIGYNYFFNAELVDSIMGTPADSFYWEITSDSFSFISFAESFSLVYLGQTDLEVKLEITSNGGCTSYIQKVIPLGVVDNCDLYIDIFPTGNFEFTLFPMLGNGNTAFFDWINIGSPNNDTLLIDSTTFLPANGTLELVASDFNQQCAVQIGICPEYQSSNFFPSSFSFPKINYAVDTFSTGMIMEQLSTVTIEYQDVTGTYSSNLADNSNSTFTITNIEDYEVNENGEKTKKLTIDYVDCTLKKAGSSEEKTISGTAVIAVAYPD